MELYVFAGPNGGGKSTLIAQFIKEYKLTDFEYISPDIYARTLFAKIPDEMEKYQKAFDFAEKVRDSALKNNKKIIIETVNSTANKFDFYKQCIEKKYRVTVVFVGTESFEINIQRVAKRVSEGGHGVDAEKIKSRYFKSMELLFPLTLFCENLFIFDNSDKFKLCVFKENNTYKYVAADMPDWVNKYFIEKLNEEGLAFFV